MLAPHALVDHPQHNALRQAALAIIKMLTVIAWSFLIVGVAATWIGRDAAGRLVEFRLASKPESVFAGRLPPLRSELYRPEGAYLVRRARRAMTIAYASGGAFFVLSFLAQALKER